MARAWNTTSECIAQELTQTLSRLEKEGGKAAKKAILGEKQNNEPDDETASNLLFVEMSASASNLAPNKEAMGKGIAAGLMWLCNVNSASSGKKGCGHSSNADCPCAPKGANSGTALARAGNWEALKTVSGASASAIAVNWGITKKACSVATGTKNEERDAAAEAAAHLEHALRALDTRMHDDGKTSGKNTLCLDITHGDGCDGGTNGNACVCYAQTKIAKFAQIPWVQNAMLAAQKLGDAKETLRSMQALQQRAQALALETTWTSARTHPPTHDTRTPARTATEWGKAAPNGKQHTRHQTNQNTTPPGPQHNRAPTNTRNGTPKQRHARQDNAHSYKALSLCCLGRAWHTGRWQKETREAEPGKEHRKHGKRGTRHNAQNIKHAAEGEAAERDSKIAGRGKTLGGAFAEEKERQRNTGKRHTKEKDKPKPEWDKHRTASQHKESKVCLHNARCEHRASRTVNLQRRNGRGKEACNLEKDNAHNTSGHTLTQKRGTKT
ncbi:Trypanosomal VSG domain [Trypanosoma vivax]|nr:Trypanosomal VSG domain [Trypanosoma vivax]